MELKIPDELEDFFKTRKSQSRKTIPFNEELRKILAKKISEYVFGDLSVNPEGKSTEDDYEELSKAIQTKFSGKIEGVGTKILVSKSYLRNIVHPTAAKERKDFSKERVLFIYHFLNEYFEKKKGGKTEQGIETDKYKDLEDRLRKGSRAFLKELLDSGLYTTGSASILPNLSMGDRIIEGVAPLEKVLNDSWKDTSPSNFMITGDGAAGKSTTLIHLWDMLLRKEAGRIPIFIPLKEKDRRESQKEFIFWFIIRNYLGLHDADTEQRNELWDYLKDRNSRLVPPVLLLLDGLNEITKDRKTLFDELLDWRQKNISWQIIITSRIDNRKSHDYFEDFYELLEVLPLNKGQIDTYYRENEWTVDVDAISRMDLSNPLSLSLFVQAKEALTLPKWSRNLNLKTPIRNHCDIFWNYLQFQLTKYESEEEQYKVKFVIFHYLPALAYKLYTDEQQVISPPTLERYIYDCSKNFNWQIFNEVFSEYFDYLSPFGSNATNDRQYAEFIKIVHKTLGLIRKGRSGYEFFHSNFTEYLSCLHIANSLEYFIRYKKGNNECSFPYEVKNIEWTIRQRTILWDITDGTPTKNSGLEAVLYSARNIFGKDEIGNTNLNLINTLKENLVTMAGVDLRSLNLLNIYFVGIPLFIDFGPKGIVATPFDGSLIDIKSFIIPAHYGEIHGLAYSRHSDYLATVSGVGILNILDLKSGQIKMSLEYPKPLVGVVYHPDGGKVVTFDVSGYIQEWDINKGKLLKDIRVFKKAEDQKYFQFGQWRFYSYDKKRILLFDDSDIDKVLQLDAETFEILNESFDMKDYAIPIEKKSGKRKLLFILGKQLDVYLGSDLISVEPNNICILNAETGEPLEIILIDFKCLSHTMSSDTSKIAFGCNDGIREMNMKTGEIAHIFHTRSPVINYANFAPNSKKIVLCASHFIEERDTFTGRLITGVSSKTVFQHHNLVEFADKI